MLPAFGTALSVLLLSVYSSHPLLSHVSGGFSHLNQLQSYSLQRLEGPKNFRHWHQPKKGEKIQGLRLKGLRPFCSTRADVWTVLDYQSSTGKRGGAGWFGDTTPRGHCAAHTYLKLLPFLQCRTSHAAACRSFPLISLLGSSHSSTYKQECASKVEACYCMHRLVCLPLSHVHARIKKSVRNS